LRMIEAHRVDGLLLASSRLSPAQLDEVSEVYAPVVLVNRHHGVRPGVGCVLVNDALAAETATEHLLARGHRRIGFLGGSTDTHSGRERRLGYARAMARAGLERPAGWDRPSAPTVEGGRQAALEFLQHHPEVTALLAYNDLVAVGAMQACETLGRAVPGSCAIVGWDDIVFASYVSPPLTTMRMPRYHLGEVAMSLLCDLMAEPTRAPEPVTLEAELVVRGTT